MAINTNPKFPQMTTEEIFELLQSSLPMNMARRRFAGYYGRIEQAGGQRAGLSPIDMRRIEFEAVRAIMDEIGTHLSPSSIAAGVKVLYEGAPSAQREVVTPELLVAEIFEAMLKSQMMLPAPGKDTE